MQISNFFVCLLQKINILWQMHLPFLYHDSDCVNIRLDGPYQAIMTNQLCSRDDHFICEQFPGESQEINEYSFLKRLGY